MNSGLINWPTKALITNDTLGHTSKKKLRLDQKLDKALEESFPCSGPSSISQPAPDNEPRGPRPVAMVNSAAGCEGGPSEALMKVTCPNCSAEAEITDGNTPFGYKIVCPVLRDHLARRCPR
jgi:hypothetical protein